MTVDALVIAAGQFPSGWARLCRTDIAATATVVSAAEAVAAAVTAAAAAEAVAAAVGGVSGAWDPRWSDPRFCSSLYASDLNEKLMSRMYFHQLSV